MHVRYSYAASHCRVVVPLLMLSSLVAGPGIAMGRNADALEPCASTGLTAAGAQAHAAPCAASDVSRPDARREVGDSSIVIHAKKRQLRAEAVDLVTYDAAANRVHIGAEKKNAEIVFGADDNPRVLRGVKKGMVSRNSTQAVNGGQMYDMQIMIDWNTDKVKDNQAAIAGTRKDIESVVSGSLGLVKVDEAAGAGAVTVAADSHVAQVNLAGATGARVLAGVKDGALASGSTQAVNGGQLLKVKESVDANISSITTVWQDLNTLKDSLGETGIGLVTLDAAKGEVVVAGGHKGAAVNIAGADGARRLSGLANGVADDDAVSLAQLRAAGAQDPGTGDLLMAVKYDDVGLGRATFGGQGGTVLANVAAGMVAAGSREAVNGGQLWDLRQDVQRQVDHLDGRVEGLEQVMVGGPGPGPGPGDGGSGDLVIGADAAIAIGAGATAADKTGIVIGHGGTVTGTGSVAIGHGATADRDASVSMGSAGSERQIIHVADATAPTDAVNLRQLDDRFQSAQAYTDARVQALDKRLDRMGAMSAAYAGMALNTAGLGGDNRVGVGVGVQNGSSALSVGYQRILGARRNVSVSLGGAFSGNESGISAGTGISW